MEQYLRHLVGAEKLLKLFLHDLVESRDDRCQSLLRTVSSQFATVWVMAATHVPRDDLQVGAQAFSVAGDRDSVLLTGEALGTVASFGRI
jgi:predicted TIM-barrel enzyme